VHGGNVIAFSMKQSGNINFCPQKRSPCQKSRHHDGAGWNDPAKNG